MVHVCAIRDRFQFRAERRSAAGDRAAHGRARARRAAPSFARHHGLRQDVHDRERHREIAKTDADHGAEQNARGAALRRDERALPEKRGRVFRQLLRLLPARGVRPVQRHVHRQRRDHQRRDRSHAPLRDARAAFTTGRDHRRERVRASTASGRRRAITGF